MNNLLKLISSCLIATIGFSQQECDVLFPTSPIYVSGQKSTFTSYTFKVYYHIIRKKNGKKPSTDISSIANANNILNSNYLSSNICFVLAGIDYIDDNGFNQFNFGEQESIDLFGTSAHSDGIDVYVVKDNGSGNNGRVNTIPGNGIIILNSKIEESSLSHEMAHIMGLYHAFEESICIENPDGSNSTTCGDLVEDTPAATFACRFLTLNCLYPCPVSYNINILQNNFMMYANNPACRTTFTNGQRERMYGIINLTSDLQQRLVPVNRTIDNFTVPYSTPFVYISEIVQEAKGILTVNDINILNGGKGAFRAENEAVLNPGFDALEGCRALVIIENICKENETQAKAAEYVVEYYENEGTRIDITGEEIDRLEEELTKIYSDSSIMYFYPNPITDKLNINIETSDEEDVEVILDILDLHGKSVIHESYTFYELHRGLEIETSTLQNGLYIVKVNYGNKYFTARIVKQ